MNSNRKEIDAEHVSGFSSIAKYQISRDISFGSVVCFQFFITSYWHFSLSISPFFCHSTRLRIINWCELIRFLCENKQQRDAYAHRTHICIFIHTMCISVCGFCIEKIFAWYGVGVIRGLKADFFSSMKSVPFLTPAKKPEHTNAIVTNVSRFAFFSLSIAAFFLTFLKILLLFHRCWALSYRTWVCALQRAPSGTFECLMPW